MSKKSVDAQRKSGVRFGVRSGCGYTVESASTIRIAPNHYDEMESLWDQQIGLDSYAKSLHKFMSDQYEQLAKRQKSWWEKIIVDIPELAQHREALSYQRGGIIKINKEPS